MLMSQASPESWMWWVKWVCASAGESMHGTFGPANKGSNDSNDKVNTGFSAALHKQSYTH